MTQRDSSPREAQGEALDWERPSRSLESERRLNNRLRTGPDRSSCGLRMATRAQWLAHFDNEGGELARFRGHDALGPSGALNPDEGR